MKKGEEESEEKNYAKTYGQNFPHNLGIEELKLLVNKEIQIGGGGEI